MKKLNNNNKTITDQSRANNIINIQDFMFVKYTTNKTTSQQKATNKNNAGIKTITNAQT